MGLRLEEDTHPVRWGSIGGMWGCSRVKLGCSRGKLASTLCDIMMIMIMMIM